MPTAFDLLGVDLSDGDAQSGVEDFDELASCISRLVDIRQALGLSQTDVARAMGTKQSVVSRLETTGGNPTVRSLQRYARAIQCSIRLDAQPVTIRAWESVPSGSLDVRVSVHRPVTFVTPSDRPWQTSYERAA